MIYLSSEVTKSAYLISYLADPINNNSTFQVLPTIIPASLILPHRHLTPIPTQKNEFIYLINAWLTAPVSATTPILYFYNQI